MMHQINPLKYLHVHDVDPEVLRAQIKENCLLQTKNSFAKAAKLGSNIFCNSCNSRELHLYWTLLEKSHQAQKEIREAEGIYVFYHLLPGLS